MKHEKPIRYVSVDVETDGHYFPRYNLISFGAVVVDDLSKKFYSEVKPISSEFSPEALAVSGLDRERLLREAPTPKEAMVAFDTWLRAEVPGFRVCVTFSTFDWHWLWAYMNMYLEKTPFNHSALEMKSYLMAKLNTSWRNTAKARAAELWPDLFKELPPHTHHALDDALEQAVLFQRLLALHA